MEESTKSNNKFLLIGLAVLLIAVSIYTIYNNSEHKKLTNAIETEKNEIAVNLDSMIAKYETAIAKNTSMSNELSLERDKIILLRDSIKGMTFALMIGVVVGTYSSLCIATPTFSSSTACRRTRVLFRNECGSLFSITSIFSPIECVDSRACLNTIRTPRHRGRASTLSRASRPSGLSAFS